MYWKLIEVLFRREQAECLLDQFFFNCFLCCALPPRLATSYGPTSLLLLLTPRQRQVYNPHLLLTPRSTNCVAR